MFIKLLVLFTLIPLLELYVLVKVGSMIGIGSTMILILLTGLAGAYLARTQGFDILHRVQKEMEAGRLPAFELLDGALILVGGVLLLTPGFCTDILGFCLLAPLSRSALRKWLRHFLRSMVDSGRIDIRRF